MTVGTRGASAGGRWDKGEGGAPRGGRGFAGGSSGRELHLPMHFSSVPRLPPPLPLWPDLHTQSATPTPTSRSPLLSAGFLHAGHAGGAHSQVAHCTRKPMLPHLSHLLFLASLRPALPDPAPPACPQPLAPAQGQPRLPYSASFKEALKGNKAAQVRWGGVHCIAWHDVQAHCPGRSRQWGHVGAVLQHHFFNQLKHAALHACVHMCVLAPVFSPSANTPLIRHLPLLALPPSMLSCRRSPTWWAKPW